MMPLAEYIIPVKGLKVGMHHFDFQVDSSFFKHFEGSPIAEGNFEVGLDFDKRHDMYNLRFDIKGQVTASCDRCLGEIQLPVTGNYELVVKLSLEEIEEDIDVAFVSPEISTLSVAKWVYEYIVLSLPLRNVFECEKANPKPCDMEMLTRLEGVILHDLPKDTDSSENPMWSRLRAEFDNEN